MERKEILALYSKHYDILIQKLAKLLITELPTIDKLELGRAAIQSIYRDIEKYKLKCNLIDFFGLVSTLYLLEEWKNSSSVDWESFEKSLKKYPLEARNSLRLFNFNKQLFISCFINFEKEVGEKRKWYKNLNDYCFDIWFNEIIDLKEKNNQLKV